MIHESELLRYVEGDCTPAEAAAIQAWLAADPQRVEQLEELRMVWRQTGQTSRRWDVASARERLRRARGLSTPAPAPVAQRRRWPAWPIAAGIVLTVVGSAAYLASRTAVRTYET